LEKGIQVMDVNFISQQLQIESKLTKKVPVQFSGELLFSSFYKLKSPVYFSPDSISISGPISSINNIHSYPIVDQKLRDIDTDLKKTVNLKQPKHYLIISPLDVQMFIKTEQITQKTLKIPVQIANPGIETYNIVPAEIEISLLIGLSEFSYVNQEDFKAQIILPLERHTNQQYAVSIVKKPSNAIIQEITPAYVDVFFDK